MDCNFRVLYTKRDFVFCELHEKCLKEIKLKDIKSDRNENGTKISSLVAVWYYVNWHTPNTNIRLFMNNADDNHKMVNDWILFSAGFMTIIIIIIIRMHLKSSSSYGTGRFFSVMHWCHVNVINDVYSSIENSDWQIFDEKKRHSPDINVNNEQWLLHHRHPYTLD